MVFIIPIGREISFVDFKLKQLSGEADKPQKYQLMFQQDATKALDATSCTLHLIMY